jgi:long-chain acyl-CoA synthetase
VYGDSLQHYVVAIIVPDKQMVEKWASENGVTAETFTELLKEEKVIKFF